jgi:glycosyltransferase involved in cell wall biosynthesis
MDSGKLLDVIIPTKNDYVCLKSILNRLSFFERIEKIIVVDNDSDDIVSEKIKSVTELFSKVVYMECPVVGKGNAIKKGLSNVDNDVLFLDADIENFSLGMVRLLLSRFDEGFDLVKADFVRINGQSNSFFVVGELMERYPNLKVTRPTGGIYLVRRDALDGLCIPDLWNVDLSILLQVYERGFHVTEAFIGIVKDKSRSRKSLLESKKCLLGELNLSMKENGT